MAIPWECLECAHVCDLLADDCCPTCGARLPEVDGNGESQDQREEREFEQLCDFYGYPKVHGPVPHQAFNPHIGLE